MIEKTLSIYSPSGNEKELASLLHSELKGYGLDPMVDSAGNVICQVGSGDKSLLLCGHMDTVPGELPVKREGDWLYGRGACDAKGPLISLFFAFVDIATKFKNENDGPAKHGRVIFAAVVEEEGASSGLNQLMKEGIRSDFAIFGEPGGVDRVTLGYRGHLSVEMTIETQQVHASAPWLTTNSIELAMSIYNELKASWPETTKVTKTNDVSLSLTEIHGGTAHNVTPGKTTMTVDIRLPIGTSSKSIKSRIETILENFRSANKGSKINVDYGEATEPYRAEMNSKLVRAMNRALIKSGSKPTFTTKSGTGDMNTYALGFGVEAVTYGPGEARLSHTIEEGIDTGEVLACSAVLYSAAEELLL